ncbi:hypothetical protein Cgig2_010400 [Carnegiea gigantea]|uniref:Protein FAR1-RELATED SEQUENCE n=1 Tax=Carnegiea gigantea TaxID=171969 RepID=A0A9Q1JJZ2_9CARY|nr:hypothetical protein Cgig2_010400 [Carnegiea gigantea]
MYQDYSSYRARKKVKHGGFPFGEKDIHNLFTKMLYKLNSPKEFEYNWPLTVEKYDLQNNKHVKGQYQIDTSGHRLISMIIFFKGMTTTGKSKSINAFIKRFVSSHTSLMDFFKQMNVAIKEIEFKRTHNNVTATVRPTSLKTRSPLEEQAFQVLAPFAFKKFQEEIEEASQYSLVHEDGNEFILRHCKLDGRMHTIFWDGCITLCKCKNFEFWAYFVIMYYARSFRRIVSTSRHVIYVCTSILLWKKVAVKNKNW